MIISRTPFRISFFGGGTDYPEWYLKHGGAVIATTINKYCYISCRYLPPFFDHRLRVVYSIIETRQNADEIAHPSVRECLKYLKITRGLEIHHDGDLPARSGMGSSSSFTVGLLHALHALSGRMPTKRQLMEESIHVEHELIKETVGSQDQALAAYGGLNHIVFGVNGSIDVRPVTISMAREAELNSHLMLFYTGIKRTASDVARSYVESIDCRKRQLRVMKDLVEEALTIVTADADIKAFGELLHEAWDTKKSLSCLVSNLDIDVIYDRAREAGALGGKITGAGGGGFLLLFVPPAFQQEVREALSDLILVPFQFESSGSQVIFMDRQEDYSQLDNNRSSLRPRNFRELDFDSR
jgi:D-glycero-alpha-D-manno-heptose-7-phosphate kinase